MCDGLADPISHLWSDEPGNQQGGGYNQRGWVEDGDGTPQQYQ